MQAMLETQKYGKHHLKKKVPPKGSTYNAVGIGTL